MPWGSWSLISGDQITTLRFSTLDDQVLLGASIAAPVNYPGLEELMDSPLIRGRLVLNEKNELVDAASIPPFPALPNWRKPLRTIG